MFILLYSLHRELSYSSLHGARVYVDTVPTCFCSWFWVCMLRVPKSFWSKSFPTNPVVLSALIPYLSPHDMFTESVSSELPVHITRLFGELFFFERNISRNVSSLWFPCIVAGPLDLPSLELRNICVNMYNNVCGLLFLVVNFDASAVN